MGHLGGLQHPDVLATIDKALGQIVAAGRTAGTLVNDDNVEHYLGKGVRFLLTGWFDWVASGAQMFKTRLKGQNCSSV